MTDWRLIYITLLLATHWLLVACGPHTIMDTATRSYRPIQGGTLELHREVSIPPGHTRVFFQDGDLVAGLNEFRPHCQLRVRDRKEQVQPVHADRFSIDEAPRSATSVAMSK